jgi:hypothetical protein
MREKGRANTGTFCIYLLMLQVCQVLDYTVPSVQLECPVPGVSFCGIWHRLLRNALLVSHRVAAWLTSKRPCDYNELRSGSSSMVE